MKWWSLLMLLGLLQVVVFVDTCAAKKRDTDGDGLADEGMSKNKISKLVNDQSIFFNYHYVIKFISNKYIKARVSTYLHNLYYYVFDPFSIMLHMEGFKQSLEGDYFCKLSFNP